MPEDREKQDNIAEPPKAGHHLDYGRRRYEPANVVVMPFLGGLVLGFSGAGCLGFTVITGMGTHVSHWGAVVTVAVIALLIARSTYKYAKTRARQLSKWFILGLLLGAGTVALLDGICFGVGLH